MDGRENLEWPTKEKVWPDKKDTGATESLPVGTGFLLRVMSMFQSYTVVLTAQVTY